MRWVVIACKCQKNKRLGKNMIWKSSRWLLARITRIDNWRMAWGWSRVLPHRDYMSIELYERACINKGWEDVKEFWKSKKRLTVEFKVPVLPWLSHREIGWKRTMPQTRMWHARVQTADKYVPEGDCWSQHHVIGSGNFAGSSKSIT